MNDLDRLLSVSSNIQPGRGELAVKPTVTVHRVKSPKSAINCTILLISINCDELSCLFVCLPLLSELFIYLILQQHCVYMYLSWLKFVELLWHVDLVLFDQPVWRFSVIVSSDILPPCLFPSGTLNYRELTYFSCFQVSKPWSFFLFFFILLYWLYQFSGSFIRCAHL